MEGHQKLDLNVLFVDVDGVLNTVNGRLQLDPILMMRLSVLVERVHAKIVLSTTWRSYPSHLKDLLYGLHLAGIPLSCILGDTGRNVQIAGQGASYWRAAEILAKADMLRNMYNLTWVAVDDLDLHVHGSIHQNNFVRISPTKGLTLTNMQEILSLFHDTRQCSSSGAAWRLVFESGIINLHDDVAGTIVFTEVINIDRIDWSHVHSRIKSLTHGESISCSTDIQSLDDPYYMALFNEFSSSPSTRRLQFYDRFVLWEGSPHDASINLSILNPRSNEILRQELWVVDALTMDLFRKIDTWLEKNLSGISWLLVGPTISQWMEASEEHGLSWPSYFHQWHTCTTSTQLVSKLDSGILISPSNHSPCELDVPSLVTSLEKFPGIIDPSILRKDTVEALIELISQVSNVIHVNLLISIAQVNEWCMRQTLVGYLNREELTQDALDHIVSIVHYIDLLDIDNFLQ